MSREGMNMESDIQTGGNAPESPQDIMTGRRENLDQGSGDIKTSKAPSESDIQAESTTPESSQEIMEGRADRLNDATRSPEGAEDAFKEMYMKDRAMGVDETLESYNVEREASWPAEWEKIQRERGWGIPMQPDVSEESAEQMASFPTGERQMKSLTETMEARSFGYADKYELNKVLERTRNAVSQLEQKQSEEKGPLGYGEALGTLLEETQGSYRDGAERLRELLVAASSEDRTPADIDRVLQFAKRQLNPGYGDGLFQSIARNSPLKLPPIRFSGSSPEAQELSALKEQKKLLSGELREGQLRAVIDALEDEQVQMLKDGKEYGEKTKNPGFIETLSRHIAAANKFVEWMDNPLGFLDSSAKKSASTETSEIQKEKVAGPREGISKWRMETLVTLDELVTNLPQGVDSRVMKQFEKFATIMSDYDYAIFTKNIERLKEEYRSTGDRPALDKGLSALFRDPLKGLEEKKK